MDAPSKACIIDNVIMAKATMTMDELLAGDSVKQIVAGGSHHRPRTNHATRSIN